MRNNQQFSAFLHGNCQVSQFVDYFDGRCFLNILIRLEMLRNHSTILWKHRVNLLSYYSIIVYCSINVYLAWRFQKLIL